MRAWIDTVRILTERPEPRKPVMPLASFIAKNGGIELDGDATANDLHKLYVPGAGPLARKSGKSIDGFWRTALADAGYIESDADGGIQRDIRDELFDLLRQEQRARYHGDLSIEHSGEDADFREIEVKVRSDLKHAGMRSVDGTLIHKAAMILWNGDAEDTLAAFEMAILSEPEPERAGHDDQDIPF